MILVVVLLAIGVLYQISDVPFHPNFLFVLVQAILASCDTQIIY